MLLMLLAFTGLAQETSGGDVPPISSQLYRVPIDSTRTLWTDDSTLAPEGYASGRAAIGYMRSPLGYWPEDDSGVPTGTYSNLVSDVVQLDLVGAYTFNRFRIGVDLPVNLLATSDVAQSVSGLGDAAVDIKGTFLQQEVDGIGMAFSLRTILPTATKAANPALGSPGLGGEFTAIVDKDVGDVRLAANVGGRIQPRTELENTVIDDQMLYRLGGGYALTEDAGVSLDVAGHVNFASINAATTPFEAMVGGYGRVTDEIVIRGGIAHGLTPAIGSPLFRGVFMVSWEPPHSRDLDLDGIGDKLDACPEEPEDIDGYKDGDGCIDPDNDGDGLLDAADSCPDEPEDADGFKDEDGCIDPETRVNISITDHEDIPVPVTALISGDTFGSELGNSASIELNPGTYMLMGDAPGFHALDATIEVPEQTEDLEVHIIMEAKSKLGTVSIFVVDPDGQPLAASWEFTDQPERDISADGASVKQQPGDYDLIVRADGYGSVNLLVEVTANKDKGLMIVLQPAKVLITSDKIDISDKVYFATGKATIKKESFGLLDEVAIILADHPELLVVRIEGHTDSRGSASGNKRLSQARADSVRDYFVSRDIAADRLISVGFGEEQPLDTAETEEAWEKNRRVTFHIEAFDADGDGKPDPIEEPAPTEAPAEEAPAEEAPAEPAPEDPNKTPTEDAPVETPEEPEADSPW